MSKSCYLCDRPLTAKQGVRISGKEITVCRDCADTKYVNCSVCGKYLCHQDLVFAGNEFVCVWCVSEKFALCPHCGIFFKEDELLEFHGHFMCRRCRSEYFQECELCRGSFEEDEFKYIREKEGGKQICLKCFREKYFYCNTCEESFPKSERHHFQGQVLCRSCFDFAVEEEEEQQMERYRVHNVDAAAAAGNRRTAPGKAQAVLSDSPFYEDGYADDYVGDGLDGSSEYVGDGLEQ